ncbi:hypothetical protein WR25_21991 [Diploscapter pachys]|uniref:Sestrin n=1 Tax=Diploscapter pachys TaxID=2018661 RepID=A0A2A2L9D9_9BILA|nr:hypothetical protein WR25_21991 [Diploscapter pachys]
MDKSSDASARLTKVLPKPWHPLLEYIQLHPQYFNIFTNTIETIFYRSAGALRLPDRHYLAIMAASRHRCYYLVRLHQREFERLGGSKDWLKGLSTASDKFQTIDRLVQILSHQPWQCNAELIMAIAKYAERGKWAMAELIQAAFIISHTVALCSVVQAVGLSRNSGLTQHEALAIAEWERSKENHVSGVDKGEVQQLIEAMTNIQTARELGEEDEAELQRANQLFDKIVADIVDLPTGGHSPVNGEGEPVYTQNADFAYVDFATRTDPAKTFKYHDFTWDHAYSTLADFDQNFADLTDTKFKCMRNLTYSFMGDVDNVDTSYYRRAIWHYIQALFGVRRDDYSYQEVNTLLNREMKSFIKIIGATPSRATDEMRDSVMPEFKMSEKVHVYLLVMEAHLETNLLHFARAIVNYNVASNPRPRRARNVTSTRRLVDRSDTVMVIE